MRRTAMYRVEDQGRDYGKVFFLTEMSAAQGEEWAMRVLLALMANDVEMPSEMSAELGMAGFAEVGLKAIGKLSFETAKPLLEELLTCVQIIPDPSKTHVYRPLVEDDVQEIMTRLKLRMEVLKLHTDFLQAVMPSIFPAGKVAAAKPRRATRTSQR